MRQYRPDAADLLHTVGDFLKSLEHKVDEGDRYQALVCGHVLAMVARELTSAPLPDQDEATLARDIRAGAHDADWETTLEAVLARTIARVAIVKPDHLAPDHRAQLAEQGS